MEVNHQEFEALPGRGSSFLEGRNLPSGAPIRVVMPELVCKLLGSLLGGRLRPLLCQGMPIICGSMC